MRQAQRGNNGKLRDREGAGEAQTRERGFGSAARDREEERQAEGDRSWRVGPEFQSRFYICHVCGILGGT